MSSDRLAVASLQISGIFCSLVVQKEQSLHPERPIEFLGTTPTYECGVDDKVTRHFLTRPLSNLIDTDLVASLPAGRLSIDFRKNGSTARRVGPVADFETPA